MKLRDIYTRKNKIYFYQTKDGKLSKFTIESITGLNLKEDEYNEHEKSAVNVVDDNWFLFPSYYREAKIQLWEKNSGMFNPFNNIIYAPVNASLRLILHEYKHYEQRQKMGLFAFLKCVGIPSVLSFTFDRDNHRYYTYEEDLIEENRTKKLPWLEGFYNKYNRD